MRHDCPPLVITIVRSDSWVIVGNSETMIQSLWSKQRARIAILVGTKTKLSMMWAGADLSSCMLINLLLLDLPSLWLLILYRTNLLVHKRASKEVQVRSRGR